jgi:hypothetical protein
MERSPSWEAASCAHTQELPSSLWNQKVHYCVHKSPSLVYISSQIDPVRTALSYLRSILILFTHLLFGVPSGHFPSGFPTKIYMHSSSPPFVYCHVLVCHFLHWSCNFTVCEWCKRVIRSIQRRHLANLPQFYSCSSRKFVKQVTVDFYHALAHPCVQSFCLRV